MRSRGLAITAWSGLLSCVALAPTALGAAADRSAIALKRLSIDELMDVEVTSVSRTAQTLSDAAAAIAVVTNEDLRRSGVTSVPEALRFVPGMHVARRTANSWAVSARGFSSVNSEKLLVLSDTRSIYTPLYSGVFWDVQDYLLQDVERIEVIRGPGAALWGSNAVNGVINITTKSARDTTGTYFEAGAGTEERISAAARYGAQTDGGVYFRVFGKYFARDATHNTTALTEDDSRLGHAGFRADWDNGNSDSFTLQADAYRGTIGVLAPSVSIIGRPGPQGDLEVDVSGGNVLGRWRRTLSSGSDIQFRAYYDRTHRDDPSYLDDLDTLDLDLQHGFQLGALHDILWGVNYRLTDNRNRGKVIFAVQPASSQDNLFGAFVQDQIALSDAAQLTLGTKLEHNDFSGFEIQPSARVAWEFMPEHTAWSAISRAVRVPTRLERDLAIDAPSGAPNTGLRLLGSDEFESEELLAYELGYRWQVSAALSADIAVFHNRYEGLASLELGQPFLEGTRVIVPIVNRNMTDGEASGFETLLTLDATRSWRLTASYSYIDLELQTRGLDINRGRFLEGATPRHELGLRSFLDLPAGLQLDAQYRYVDEIQSLPDIVSGEGIAGYSELDVRLAWRSADQLEIAVVGQNLLHSRHPEFGTPEARGEIERGVYAKVAWGF